jgi:hypothetical protein
VELGEVPAQALIDNDQIRAIPKSHRESVTFTGIQHKETTVFPWRWLDLNPLHIPQVGNFDSATSHALLDDARHNADVAVLSWSKLKRPMAEKASNGVVLE